MSCRSASSAFSLVVLGIVLSLSSSGCGADDASGEVGGDVGVVDSQNGGDLVVAQDLGGQDEDSLATPDISSEDALVSDAGAEDVGVVDVGEDEDTAEEDTSVVDAVWTDLASVDDTLEDSNESPDIWIKKDVISWKDVISLKDIKFPKDSFAVKDAKIGKDIFVVKDAKIGMDVQLGEDTSDAKDTEGDTTDGGPSTSPGPLFPYVKFNPKELESWRDNPPICAPGDLLGRYFLYRRRMRGPGDGSTGGFVGVGDGPGLSLLSGAHDPDSVCKTDWWVNDGQCKVLDKTAKGRMHYGDTTIWHGWYLTFLASEYAAFSKLGLDLKQTQAELYSALKAFNRLDADAETHFGKPGKVDGFFVRTDVNSGLVKTKAGAWRFPHPSGKGGFGCVLGGSDCKGVSIDGGYFESQDQAVAMMLGLTAVWKLVPPGTKYAGMDLHQEARAALHRIVSFVRGHKWKITAPNGKVPPAQWGGSAVPFSDELAKGANRVCGKSFGVKNYRDLISQTQGAGTYAALGTSWAVQTDSNRAMASECAVVTGVWDQNTFESRVSTWGVPYYALLYAVLQGKSGLVDKSILWQLQSHLAEAPCGGPCSRTSTCTPGPRWQGENILKSPDYRGGCAHTPRGEYPGVDYLILYNMWVLLSEGKTQLSLPKMPAATLCKGKTTLATVLASGQTSGTVYATDPCQADTLKKLYCGRSFAKWLEDAATGKATIFTNKARWKCSSKGVCTLSAHQGQGTSGSDLFIGGAGADTFNAGDGADCLVGGVGDDVLMGGQGRDELWGGEGADKLYGESDGVVLSGAGDLLMGGAGNDLLKAGPGRDDLWGGAGHDTLDGGGGDDFLFGGDGNDILLCGDGADYAMGEVGDDAIKGEGGKDALWGGVGRDKMDGGTGDDSLVGGAGDDFLHGGTGDDTLWGEGGDDHLCGGNGKDSLNGGWSSKDGCRAKGTLDFSSDKEEGCGFKLKSSQCSNSAYNAW